MEINLLELWASMNYLVRGVVIVLSVQALGCLLVAVDRIILLVASRRQSRKFAKAVGPSLGAGNYDRVLEIVKSHRSSHLAQLIETGVEVFVARKSDGHPTRRAVELAERALERKGENLSTSLHRGMNILASTGSTAPFIGLLGTVLGILNAFRLVGEEGSGGMGTIGVAISEALIVTGYGLLVAIPSVLIFNWLNGRIAKYEASLANASSELVDRLDSGPGRDRRSRADEDESSPMSAVQVAPAE